MIFPAWAFWKTLFRSDIIGNGRKKSKTQTACTIRRKTLRVTSAQTISTRTRGLRKTQGYVYVLGLEEYFSDCDSSEVQLTSSLLFSKTVEEPRLVVTLSTVTLAVTEASTWRGYFVSDSGTEVECSMLAFGSGGGGGGGE